MMSHWKISIFIIFHVFTKFIKLMPVVCSTHYFLKFVKSKVAGTCSARNTIERHIFVQWRGDTEVFFVKTNRVV